MADISVSLVLDDKGFVKSINQAQTQVKDLGKSVDKETSMMSTAFAGLKGAIASIGITSLIGELNSMASEIVKTAQSLGTSTTAVKAWQDSLGAAGGDIDNARDALIDLTQKMNEAITSGGDVQKAFQKIGLSLNDLQTMSNEDMMKATIQGLAKVTDGAERSRLALVLMGEDAKNVDWTKVARDYETVAKNAANIAPSLESARRAQQEFNSTYNIFKDQLTAAIPWDTLTEGLKTIGDNASKIMETAKSIGILVASLAGLQIIGKIASAITNFGTIALGAAAGTTALSGTLLAMKNTIDIAKNGWSALIMALSGIGSAFKSWQQFSAFITLLTGGISRLIPVVGAVVTGFTLLNEAVRLLTGTSIVEWAEKQTRSFRNLSNDLVEAFAIWSGLKPGNLDEFLEDSYRRQQGLLTKEQELNEKRKKIYEDTLNWIDEADAAEAKSQETKQRTSQLLEQTKKSVSELVTGYQQQNAETLKSIQDQTSLIGLSTEAANKKRALIDLENEHIKKVQELNAKLAEPNLDPQEIEIYKKAIADVNAEYDKQKIAIAGAIDAQTKKVEANRLEEFTNQSLISSMQRIMDINNETATMTLPLIEKKYYDIKAAADAAIESQLLAEAKARGITVEELPADYVAKVKEIGNARVQMEKDVADAQERVIRNRDLDLFKQQQSIDANQKIVDIHNELNNAILPEIQRKRAEILQSAEAEARAAIRAEEARRGSAMSEEEKAKYVDAATKSVQGLIKVTEESYEQSRTWSYGWTKAWNEYRDNATNSARQAGEFFNKTMTGMEDVLVNFARTGKIEWKNFVAELIADLLRAQIQSLFANTIGSMIGIGDNGKQTGGGLMGAVSSIFGGSSSQQQKQSSNSSGGFWSGVGNVVSGLFGGIGSGIKNLFGGFFATGGMIPPGRFGIVGENGPEYVSGPANVTPASQMATNVTYNINAVDARSFKEMLAADPSFLYAVTLQGAKSIPGRR